MLKLFHTSDWHLGRMLYGRSMLSDQEYFIKQVFLPAVRAEKPDLVLLSGDIYDRQIAQAEAIRLFDFTLSALMETGAWVAFTAGNHDGAERMTILKDVLRASGVYTATDLSDAFSPVEMEKRGEKIQLFLIPYLDNSVVRDHFGDERLRGEAACMRRALDECRAHFKPGYTKIVSAHCFVAGSSVSDSESVFVGGSGEVPADIFSGFDYAALGHLHRAQKAGPKGRYSGSPLKYSIDEESHHKSFVSLEIERGVLTETLLPVAPLHDVRRVSGLFSELLEQDGQDPCRDYVEIVLTDREPVLLAAEKLRPYYPNMLTISNRWTASGTADRAARVRQQDDLTIFQAFMKEICDIDTDEEDCALFSSLLRETQPDC